LPENELNLRLGGVFLPVTTPFDEVTGEIAPVALRDNLRRYIDAGVDGLLLFGSTGEGALLDEAEMVRATSWAREVVPAGVPLLVGSSMESTRATIRLTSALAAAGADAALVHPPSYFGAFLPPGALLDYYRAVADASPIPLLVYHMPKYTKVTIDAGLMGEITRHANVLGFKDSSGDIKRFADYTQACGDGCRMFVGNGTLLYTALELGAAGGILAIADLVPARCLELVAEFRAGNTRNAGEIQSELSTVHREIVATWGATGVKAGMDLLGWAGGPARPPLRALGEKERRQVEKVLREAGALGALR
jgi:4-hydroxy-2-oxoglutarate aldolase